MSKVTIKNATLYHGDCFKIVKSMHDKMCNLIVTDIPYGLPRYKSSKHFHVDRGNANIANFNLDELAVELIRLSKESIYVFCGKSQISSLCDAMGIAGMTTRLIIWEKPIHVRCMGK